MTLELFTLAIHFIYIVIGSLLILRTIFLLPFSHRFQNLHKCVAFVVRCSRKGCQYLKIVLGILVLALDAPLILTTLVVRELRARKEFVVMGAVTLIDLINGLGHVRSGISRICCTEKGSPRLL